MLAVLYRLSSLRILRYRGARAGRRRRRNIGVVQTTLRNQARPMLQIDCRHSSLVVITACRLPPLLHSQVADRSLAGMYIINTWSIAKTHALQHLQAELIGYNLAFEIVSKTHLKKHHSSSIFRIDGYQLFRGDRQDRRVVVWRSWGVTHSWPQNRSFRVTLIFRSYSVSELIYRTGRCFVCPILSS